ncbi:MAG: tungstate ABC transporter substrate-binding protein WtpA [Actinobacteria bacterium]|nr:tungstate ABC transporter substrate-binding protein WtpA [Actinomycetota bacterium]
MRWWPGLPTRRAAAALAAALACALAFAAFGTGCGSDERQVKLIYAGSLIVPFERVAAAFERQHPGVDVVTEAHGSIQVLRHVTELGDRMDIVASADEQLIPPLMYERDDPETGAPWADWYCSFATNRVVLAVSPQSPLAGELTSKTWYRRLIEGDVRFGLADPRFDAAGYRALMVLQLAEREYGEPFLLEDMLMGRFTTPITVEHSGGTDVIEVPEILETSAGSSIVLRGASIQLVALLESGDLDCAFEYESVARQHGLQYVELPPSIDLSDPDRRDDYATVRVKLDFRRFASVRPEFTGDLIRYAFTIPANAPDPELAREFAAFLLGSEGRRMLAADHQPLLSPPELDDAAAAPEEVRRACAGR